MKRKIKAILSILLVGAMLLGLVPSAAFEAEAATNNTKVADASTMDDWKNYFSTSGNITTENAGGVWTDKSVFENNNAFKDITLSKDIAGNTTTNANISIKDENGFLVALSAIASNTSVSGVASAPTDTMIILDLSSSMYGQTKDPSTVNTMVEAVNDTIKKLQDLNPNNRVGVTIYFGGPNLLNSTSTSDCGKVILPLSRYTHESNKFLKTTVKNGALISMEVNSAVKNSANQTVKQEKHTVPDVAGTYAQLGILHAMEQFLAADTIVPADSSYQPDVTRTPVFVFMSDGEPTAATHKFNDKTQTSGMGNNRVDIRNPNETDFVTQLTAAYAREQVDAHYAETTPLFYTLSLGTSISKEVMDPAHNTTDKIDGYWNNIVTNGKVTIEVQNCTGEWTIENRKTTQYTVQQVSGFPSNVSQKNYVDKAFTAVDASKLADAFDSIFSQIELQTHYFPTLVEGNEDVDGYISFVDKIGKYMSVTDVKGILIRDSLFSGACLAKNFVTGGGELGTYDNPTSLGDELVWAVQARLGISDVDKARTLLGLAYEYGQLSYDSKTGEFSNYIGWYADKNGKYLDFWHEDSTTQPGNAVYIIKSYGYLGETVPEQGVENSDMMYATVQVRTEIATGEETVAFAVPAALIPIISYDISLDSKGNVNGLDVSGAENPIRLLYEVALDEGINEITISDPNVVDADYVSANKNDDGSVNFYTNQYEVGNSTGYDKVNTYSYFRPSKQNEKYYYQSNATIYVKEDAGYKAYEGTTRPQGECYRAYTVYEIDASNNLSTKTVYRSISEEILKTAEENTDNTWYIPKGTVYTNLDGYTVDKTTNATKTLPWVNVPFIDVNNPNANTPDHNYVIGATLGNNGRISVKPTTGIVISKTVNKEHASAQDEEFEFTITNSSEGNKTYSAIKVTADGTESKLEVKFDDKGDAVVQLKDGEKVYITGMPADTTYTVTEGFEEHYVIAGVEIDDIAVTGTTASITTVNDKMGKIDFTNTARGVGDITITKYINHSSGAGYEVSTDKTFNIDVTLKLNGQLLTEEYATKVYDSVTESTTDGSIKMDSESKKAEITLGHNDQIEILDLPEGTEVTVTEQLDDSQKDFYAVSYKVNGSSSDDGIITIRKDVEESIAVINTYKPLSTKANITVGGTKTLETANSSTITDWGERTFTFELQKYNSETKSWTKVGEQKTATNTNPSFTFDMSSEEYTKPGTYAYQVFEVVPNPTEDKMFYDPIYHTFHVTVVDDNGQLKVSDVVSDHADEHVTQDASGNWIVTTDFKNVTYDTLPALATIQIQKVLTGDINSPNAVLYGYQFGLYTDKACQTEATIGDGILNIDNAPTDMAGEGWIDITFDKEGTYTFYIKEVSGSNDKITYSKAVTEVKIVVSTKDTGDLYVSDLGYEDGVYDEDTDEVVFTNEYNPTPTSISFNVKKELTGRDMKAEEFTFEILDKDGNSLTGTNDASGKVTLPELQFDKVGTYQYQVVETTSDGNGVTTDKTVYNVYVTVTDNDGKLSAAYSVAEVVGNTMTFKNTYKASGTYTISGTKVLEGKSLVNDEFTFELYEADSEGKITNTKPISTAKNHSDGTFAFNELTFNESDAGKDYYYVVSEKGESVSHGVSFDESQWLVKLAVSDNADGTMTIAEETIRKGDKAPGPITFTNKYTAKPTAAQIGGDKELTGQVLTEGKFSFELYESDLNWSAGDLKETVSNNENGEFTFKELDYDAAGTYYYLVKEVNGGQTIDGIVYDDTVYHVRIEITDDLRGQLHPEIYIYNGETGDSEQEMWFRNAYAITGDKKITIEGTKTLTGRDLKKGEFIFELYDVSADEVITADKNSKKGKFEFDLKFKAEDVGKTFEYIVREQAGDIEGVTYDSSEYLIIVKVIDDEKGRIATEVTMEKDNHPIDEITFNNIYEDPEEPTDPETPQEPSKDISDEPKDNTPGAVDTGDSTNIIVYLVLALAAAAAIIALVVVKRKGKNR